MHRLWPFVFHAECINPKHVSDLRWNFFMNILFDERKFYTLSFAGFKIIILYVQKWYMAPFNFAPNGEMSCFSNSIFSEMKEKSAKS